MPLQLCVCGHYRRRSRLDGDGLMGYQVKLTEEDMQRVIDGLAAYASVLPSRHICAEGLDENGNFIPKRDCQVCDCSWYEGNE
jgi:hypothetical protein